MLENKPLESRRIKFLVVGPTHDLNINVFYVVFAELALDLGLHELLRFVYPDQTLKHFYQLLLHV